MLEGRVPDGSDTRLGRRARDGSIEHRPGRDLTLSAPKSVSLAALVGGDARVTDAHDRAVARTLDWFEKNVAETRMKDPETGRMVRTGGQKTVIATFRHDTSRNLDPALHTHAVIANMVKAGDGGTPRSGKWRSMANERLYESKMLLGALYRSELAAGLARLGYGIEKTHADGRFEIAGVSREVVEAFSTRRAEIEAAVAERGGGETANNQRLAQRAALMTRAAKRDVDRGALRSMWEKQAEGLGFDARGLAAEALSRDAARDAGEEARRENGGGPAGGNGAMLPAGVSLRKRSRRRRRAPRYRPRPAPWNGPSPISRSARRCLRVPTCSPPRSPGTPVRSGIGDVEREVAAREKAGTLHAARLPGAEGLLTTDRAVADERETVALMRAGERRGAAPMRARAVDKALRGGPLTHGQKEAVKLILSSGDRTVGVQGYAGSGKTTMLRRARALLEKKGYEVRGLAPSASAARTLEGEAGIGSETLQRFLARYAGVAEGRMTRKGERDMRAAFAKTALVVDEGSLASTVQTRNLLRIADALRIPRVVLVGDAKQLDAVDAGKPFAQLQKAGMKTAVMDEIMRQRDPVLKEAVEASLAGDVARAFGKLGENVAEVKPDNLAGAAAARWLALSPEERANAGLMAPSHGLREAINGIVRERLVRDGAVHGPAMTVERLVSRGYTSAEKTLAANYRPGDVVAFHRPYKRLGVEKGDELRVAGVNHGARTVNLDGADGQAVAWEPNRIAARAGGVEVYRGEDIELRAGDRIRWTRNDAGLGLVNSGAAEVAAVRGGRVTFRLEDGRTLDLAPGDPQLRHLDRAWASTVHAFQGRTVDTVIAAMEANHRHLTTQKSFYVEISRARDRAELVTDDRAALKEQLEAATGERIAALEAVGADKAKEREAGPEADRSAERGTGAAGSREREGASPPDLEPVRAPKGVDRELGL